MVFRATQFLPHVCLVYSQFLLVEPKFSVVDTHSRICLVETTPFENTGFPCTGVLVFTTVAISPCVPDYISIYLSMFMDYVHTNSWRFKSHVHKIRKSHKFFISKVILSSKRKYLDSIDKPICYQECWGYVGIPHVHG